MDLHAMIYSSPDETYILRVLDALPLIEAHLGVRVTGVIDVSPEQREQEPRPDALWWFHVSTEKKQNAALQVALFGRVLKVVAGASPVIPRSAPQTGEKPSVVGEDEEIPMAPVNLAQEANYDQLGGTKMNDRSESESAYRRGFMHGAAEVSRIILELVEMGYERRKIKQFLAIYEDHYLNEWRNNGDLEKKEPFPDFNIQEIEEIAVNHRGYDWLLHE